MVLTIDLDPLFQESLRSLLLPVPPADEARAAAAAATALAGLGVAAEDAAAWLDLELADWRATGRASKRLAQVIRACLAPDVDDPVSQRLADSYLRLHRRLTETALFSHETASAFLSHARLMESLASDERLSAAQIARVISARDPHLPITWDLVVKVLRAIGTAPEIGVEHIEALNAADEASELARFADASHAEAVAMIDERAQRLGYAGSLASPLLALVPAQGVRHGAYVQMLHYVCAIAEFYDHALTALYEFSPRGEGFGLLFERYPAALNVAAGNPVLNNAKSVGVLDRSWAWSKRGPQQEAAHALVSIVEGLERLGFASRRELAGWIRAWLCRLIRLARGQETTVPATLTDGERDRLLAAVSAQNTGTRGIVEQRVVDAFGRLLHPEPTWIARGLGDSVNAPNVPRRKCGDCDFQDGVEQLVVAYEAHGGKLTDVYLRGHVRTLGAVIAARREEWDRNFEVGLPWTLRVVFVAHDVTDVVPGAHDFEHRGVTVLFDAITYDELLGSTTARPDELDEALREHVLRPLDEPRTPDGVRRTFLQLLS